MNIELSKDNHFKFGYDNQAFNFRETIDNKWTVSYGPCQRPVMSFKDECIETAKIIFDKAKGKVKLLFSGGVDSEVALQAFVLAKLPISVAIARFKNDLNVHDISYAVIACEKMGVPYQFFELDLLRFWEEKLFDYSDPTYCISPQLLTTMWLVDQFDEYPVLGSGECLIAKRIPNDYIPGISPYDNSEWDLLEKEKIAAWYRHFIIRHREGCPGFFQYTPEIILSYLVDPFVERLTSNQIEGKLCTASSKLAIYQQYFDLISRLKFSGFEKVQEQDAIFRKRLVDKYVGCSQIYYTSVKDLKEELLLNFDYLYW